MLTEKQKQTVIAIHYQHGNKLKTIHNNFSDYLYELAIKNSVNASWQDIINYQNTDEYSVAFNEYRNKYKLALKIIQSSIPKDIDAVWTFNVPDFRAELSYYTTEYLVLRFSTRQTEHTYHYARLNLQ